METNPILWVLRKCRNGSTLYVETKERFLLLLSVINKRSFTQIQILCGHMGVLNR